MQPTRSPAQGETLTLGSPATGEVVITVDPTTSGAPFAAGTQTLRPGAEIPLQRHLDREMALFVHKGQGRATLESRHLVVLPGAMVSVPRGTWYGLRNTGTGDLRLVWIASSGAEALFRELARAGASPSAQFLQELTQRHGIEFRQAAVAEAPPSARPRRRGRRGGRRHRRGPDRSPVASSPSPPASPAPSVAPTAAPDAPSAPAGGGTQPRPRRHRRGGRRRGRAAPPASVPPSAQSASRPQPDAQRPRRDRRRRRVKEVFMSGRWIQVEGEGPVIAPGRQSGQRGERRLDDDEPPDRPLSVPL